MSNYSIDLIVLAGYLKLIGNRLISKYTIINTHPSLLPKFGGKGMYGMNVHKAVVEAKEELKRALKEYPGTILLVCHEPDFYEDWVNEIWDASKWSLRA